MVEGGLRRRRVPSSWPLLSPLAHGSPCPLLPPFLREAQRELALQHVDELMTGEEKDLRAKEQYKRAQEVAARVRPPNQILWEARWPRRDSRREVQAHSARLGMLAPSRQSLPLYSQEAAKVEHQRKLDALREWEDEEVRMLDKAVAKFPQVSVHWLSWGMREQGWHLVNHLPPPSHCPGHP